MRRRVKKYNKVVTKSYRLKKIPVYKTTMVPYYVWEKYWKTKRYIAH